MPNENFSSNVPVYVWNGGQWINGAAADFGAEVMQISKGAAITITGKAFAGGVVRKKSFL
jgi:hypothetical protein